MRAAIVIPALNEVQSVGRVVAAVRAHGAPLVVDDGSTDGTGEAAVAAGAELVRHAANRGYDAALQSGFERAAALGMEAVVTFDADGQHDPGILGDFLRPLESGEAELVLGVRPRPARTSEWAFSLYTRFRYDAPDILCGLKGYSMTLYRAHGRFDGTRSIGTELALAALRRGVATKYVRVPIHPRRGAPRFGSSLRANARILRAMLLAVRADLAA